MLDAAWSARCRLGTLRRFHECLMHVPLAWQEVGDPQTQPRDNHHGADSKKAQPEWHSGYQEGHAKSQYERRDRWPWHFDGVRRGLRWLRRSMRLACHSRDPRFVDRLERSKQMK
jgi:hypothetical protein